MKQYAQYLRKSRAEEGMDAKQYAITGIPFKILIGKDGVIVDKGFARSGSLEKAMDEYLNKVK